MTSARTVDVFTPAQPAQLTFVERKSINDKLVDGLLTRGKQVLVYGSSGSGKSTLIANKLHQVFENHITTRCMAGQTLDELIRGAFDELEPFYQSERQSRESRSKSGGVEFGFAGFRGELGASGDEELHSKDVRAIPFQLSAQRLAKTLGNVHCAWVLEDFHNIVDEEKRRLAQMMKVFNDTAFEYPDTKIIVVGVAGAAEEILRYHPEMRNRICEIHVPAMSDDELYQVLAKGEVLLNIEFDTNAKQTIVDLSRGQAAVCHQLAYYACSTAEIGATCSERTVLTRHSVDNAWVRYVDDHYDNMKLLFESALRRDKRSKYHNRRLILSVLCTDEYSRGATVDELLDAIRAKEQGYRRSNLSRALGELLSDKWGALLIFDHHTERYCIANPFHRAFAVAYFGLSTKAESEQLAAKYMSSKRFDEEERERFIELLTTQIMDKYN